VIPLATQASATSCFTSERAPDLSQSTPARFFARQPILDRQKQVFGYEFLFRAGRENSFCISSLAESEAATRLMVDNSILYDFESLAVRGKAFLNCTRDALISGLVTLLPARSTILEILEDIEPDNEVLEACRRLRALGYQFSLDDFVPRPGLERFLPFADYIKIDFRLSDPFQRANILRFLKGCDARLIAEKVEEQAEFQAAVEEGFELFQGYFFCRPDVLARNHIPSNYLSHLQILAAVSQPSFEWHTVEKLVRRDTSLCYRLLRLVNSANFALRYEITSIERALIVAGEDHFRRMVTVAIAAECGRDHSPELVLQTLQRASFCELAAAHLNEDPTEQYLFGLLSLLPAMLGIPMSQVVELLPVRAPIKDALLGESNDVRRSLDCFQKYQSGHWECLGCNGTVLCPKQMHELYRTSLLWAEECTASMKL
jgi:EAL and modified HD-GYP domain-containing signal transduction protein